MWNVVRSVSVLSLYENLFFNLSIKDMKTYAEINEKIKKGTAVVLTAEEVSELSKSLTAKEIAQKVDVVTTATFGAMCSSGAFLNFGHATPPIRMEKIELNGVRVSGGLAAVDTYVGATDCDPAVPAYGGAHIIDGLMKCTLEVPDVPRIALMRRFFIIRGIVTRIIMWRRIRPTRLNILIWGRCCRD